MAYETQLDTPTLALASADDEDDDAWFKANPEPARLGLVYLSVLALFVGIVGGLGAVVFRDLIGLIHNILFLGVFRVQYDANVFTPPNPWGLLIIAVPVIGAIGVTFLVSNFAPEAKGHGVPEVMEAIYYRGGVIRPIVALIKSVASALAIGSGAAVGREGPIIQIGSAFGSTLGQILKMSPGERVILVAAGAGAGIAATFNTPIGGVMFAVELMLPEVSISSFMPVAISTGTATFLASFFFGEHPAFHVPPLQPLGASFSDAGLLCLYAVLGILAGIGAAAFVRGLGLLEDWFERIPGDYLRHGLGMLLVGILIYILERRFGHYYVEGVGYATIQAILLGQLSFAWLMALLFICKLFATTVSLGSGSSGGIFSPSLFMGAAIGGAFAAALHALHVPIDVSVPAFAMVGMGAMVGAGTGAAMTAVTMIFEMTRDYSIVLPMILAVAMALGVRRMLSRENIYTLKLARRGQSVPKALHTNMFLVRRAEEVMTKDALILPAETAFDEFLAQPGHDGRMRHVIVTRGSRIVGVLRVNTRWWRGLGNARSGITLGELAQPDFTVVRTDDVVFDVIQRMLRRDAIMALVIRGDGRPRPENLSGVIDKEHIAEAVAASVQVYPA